jgi:predicted component of viral defense system (DUF524 family)
MNLTRKKKIFVEQDIQFESQCPRIQSTKCVRLTNEHKQYHTLETTPELNIIIVERDKIDNFNTQICDRSLFWLGTGTSKKKWRG